ncbi:glycerophosphotransferase [Listeria booriae]|uniref:CDP-glycerol glycerophosphotransferase family protein n=1 Tax=Listeria booriae TaxID=1552123 RepID=UPI00162850D2|nr:CDP-glycerol glycerophosphotransferase family protein [Listeria booriae]MBC2100070.1 glycerophosphotransferase [Listeria booriae]
MFHKFKQTFRLIKNRFSFGNYAYHYWFLPIQKNKIVVTAHEGRGYSDSPKYIIDELLDQNFDIVWLIQEGQETSLPAGIRPVRYGTKQALKELSTAKIWLDNCRKKYSPPKRKGQIYIQTWHSPLRLKKIEKDAEQQLPLAYLDRAKRDAKKCDYMLAGATFSRELYENAFWFQGEVLTTGTPRCDLFWKDTTAIRQRVADFFQVGVTTKFLLYAPTFRKEASLSVYLQEFTDLKRALQTRFGSDWKIFVRLHPNIASLAKELVYDSNVLPATDYPDMQELIATSDMLITDYSSCMFDMAIAGKKTILYTPDLTTYLRTERSLYFDIEELPFPIAMTVESLVQEIHQFDEAVYQQNMQKFYEQTGLFEKGTAAIAVATKIKALCR